MTLVDRLSRWSETVSYMGLGWWSIRSRRGFFYFHSIGKEGRVVQRAAALGKLRKQRSCSRSCGGNKWLIIYCCALLKKGLSLIHKYVLKFRTKTKQSIFITQKCPQIKKRNRHWWGLSKNFFQTLANNRGVENKGQFVATHKRDWLRRLCPCIPNLSISMHYISKTKI